MQVHRAFRDSALALVVLLVGAFGISGVATATIVSNIGSMSVGDTVITSCGQNQTTCTNNPVVGASGGALPVSSGFTHQIHFTVTTAVSGAAITQTVTGSNISITSMNLYLYVGAANGNDPGDADAAITTLVATGAGGPVIGGFSIGLVNGLAAGTYFAEIIGTTTGDSAAYSHITAISAVPLPPALLLLGAALLGLIGVGRVRRARAAA